MATLEKVGVLSSAKLLAGLMAVVGLVAGIFYSFGGAIIDVLVIMEWVTSCGDTRSSLGHSTRFPGPHCYANHFWDGRLNSGSRRSVSI